jgi:hypothetical protein
LTRLTLSVLRLHAARIYLCHTLVAFNRNPMTGSGYLSPSLHQSGRQRRNINLLSIAYAFQPRLRSRLTQGGRTFPWKPWTFDGQDSHLAYRYLYRHTHFQALHRSFRSGFDALGTLTYQSIAGFRSFGTMLSPGTFSARVHSTSELLRTL